MMDDRRDRLDELLEEAARDYHVPPPVPKAEMWERIQSARRAASGGSRRKQGGETIPLYPLAPRWWARPSIRYGAAAAALLALGVAIGRLGIPARESAVPSTPTLGAYEEGRRGRDDGLPTRLVAVQHLTEVDAFFTEFRAGDGQGEFPAQARKLLSTTRLLLDSRRVGDPRLRFLLEDLEIVLAQIATFDSNDRGIELDLIADGIAQTQLRSRLRSAIPAGPIVQM